MTSTPLQLRPAEATQHDTRIFSLYLDEVAPFYRIILGRRTLSAIAAAFRTSTDYLSFGNTMFAEYDGAVVGMISGYACEAQGHSANPIPHMAEGRKSLRTIIMGRLLARQQRFLHTYRDGDYYIQALIVSEKHRRKSVGKSLMGAIEDRARSLGARRLILDVEAKNGAARRLYERQGMTVESGWPNGPLLRDLLLRMTKNL